MINIALSVKTSTKDDGVLKMSNSENCPTVVDKSCKLSTEICKKLPF